MTTADIGDRPIPNSYWVVRGRLAAGEYPGSKDPVEAAEKMMAGAGRMGR